MATRPIDEGKGGAVSSFLTHVITLHKTVIPTAQPTGITNKTIKKRMLRTMERSSVHGFSDFVASKNRFERAFWFTAVMLALSVMAYEMSHVIIEYRSETVAADIIPSEVTSYPAVIYCPFDWVDPNMARKLGFGNDHYRYLESLFIYGRLFRHFISDKANYSNSLSEQRHNFDSFLNNTAEGKSPSLESLLERLSYHPDDVFPDAIYGSEIEKVAKIVNQFGLCYEVTLPTHHTTYLYMAEMSLHVRRMKAPFLSDHDLRQIAIERHSHLLIGYVATGVSPLEGHIVIDGSYIYQIKLRAVFLRRQSTRTRQCRTWNTKVQLEMYGACINNFCRSVNACIYVEPKNLSSTVSTSHLCSRMSYEICYPPVDVQRSCWGDAPVPCDEWTYESSIARYPMTNESNKMVFYLSFSNPLSVMQISEHKIYSFESFISNVGGQISLWCGASVLSIVQLFYFLVKYLNLKKRKELCQKVLSSSMPNGAKGDGAPIDEDKATCV